MCKPNLFIIVYVTYFVMAYNLKSEEEVKEYIKNLGTEYRFGCYSEKKPEGYIKSPLGSEHNLNVYF